MRAGGMGGVVNWTSEDDEGRPETTTDDGGALRVFAVLVVAYLLVVGSLVA